jgi:DNA-binding response OmpR family regulator
MKRILVVDDEPKIARMLRAPHAAPVIAADVTT